MSEAALQGVIGAGTLGAGKVHDDSPLAWVFFRDDRNTAGDDITTKGWI
jgi:hypothetical protein